MAILHLDDNDLIRDVVRRALGASGFSVVSADSVRTAQLALAEREDIAGALLDVRLRDGRGVDLYWWIATQRPALAKRVAFLSGSAGTEAFAPLAALGCPILPKPFELADLRRFAAEWEAAADPSAQPR